ncbi:MAG: alpha/beta fold hydrolase [Saprospiraceae bacterium]|nr:alpha/beta fold hydrolase [Saprospiraceae bacterium]
MNESPMKPILMLHGALGCAADFAPLQAALNGNLLSVAIDFPGHGLLAALPPDRFSIEEFSQTVSRYASGQQKLRLFGYSMGGYVSLYFASLFPEMVEKVFTLGTKLAWTPETGAKEAGRLDPTKILEKVPLFAASLAQKHGADHWEKNVANTAGLLRALGEAPPLTNEALGRIQAEVLMARGSLDNMVSEEECRQAVGLIPRASYVRLEDQPHPLDQCDPSVVAAQLRAFFNEG